MGTVSDILEAIRTLPRPKRMELFERLATELDDESRPPTEDRVPSDPRLELRNGFYVFTGAVDVDAGDHRKIREERADHIARLAGAGRD